MSKHDELRKLIFSKYGSLLLDRKQVSEILNISVATLDRWKKDNLNLEYKKNGSSKNARVEYSVDAVVNYILNNNAKIN